MGRRIPKSRRHKKLKSVDPCYSNVAKVENRRFGKNDPPKHEGLQEVPHNMRELIDSKQRAKMFKSKRRRKKKNILKNDFIIVKREKIENEDYGITRPLKPVPQKMVQKPNESVKHFLNKLQQLANAAITEAAVEEKYDIDLVHVDDKNVAVVPAEKNSEDTSNDIKKESSKLKRNKKKIVRKAKNDEDEPFKDNVQFGEVVLEPPTLTSKPRKSGKTGQSRFKDLHLMKMLNNESQQSPSASKLSDFKQKRKNMPVARRKILEEERLRIVNEYRSLKQKNRAFQKN